MLGKFTCYRGRITFYLPVLTKKYASQNILTSLISEQYFWILCLDKHNKCGIGKTRFLALKKLQSEFH